MPKDQPHVVIIHGPNLNLLGVRNPEVYGSRDFGSMLDELRSAFPHIRFGYLQSNHEGRIIDWLHEYGFSATGIILNAGALAHTSIAIRDAVEAITTPVIDVHISDIYKREVFRKAEVLRDVCAGAVIGKGLQGYHDAVKLLLEL